MPQPFPMFPCPMFPAKAAAIVALLAAATIRAPAAELYVAVALPDATAVEVVDTEREAVTRRIEVPKRLLPERTAARLSSAEPPWVAGSGDRERRRRAGKRHVGKTVSVETFPEALAAAGTTLYGGVGDETPGFVFTVDAAQGDRAGFYDTLQRHTLAIAAAGPRAFVSYANQGVWSIDPASRRATRVDDRYRSTVGPFRLGGGREVIDDAWRGAVSSKGGRHDRMVSNGCSLLAVSRDRRFLYVAGLDPFDGPAVFVFDVAAARLVKALRLGDPRDDNPIVTGLATSGDGTVYAAVSGTPRKALALYRIDAGDNTVVDWRDIDLAGLADGDNQNPLTVAVGGEALFLASGTRFGATSLTHPAGLRVTELPSAPRDLVAMPDGRKVYAILPGANEVLPIAIDGEDLRPGKPIAIEGHVGPVALGGPAP
jgi:DNA-binding beta-propeller fold protein YncE